MAGRNLDSNQPIVPINLIPAVSQQSLVLSDTDTFTSSLKPSNNLYLIIKIVYTDLWLVFLEPSAPQAPLSRPGLPVQGPRSETDPFHTSAISSISQECDQVHIDDVASDDNGQDLR